MIYPLRDYARAWYRGDEMKSLFIAGDKVWTKVKTIKDYYGIGPGQIPIHHTPSNTDYIETFAGGRVSRSINRGGAGTVFDMTGVAGVAPRVEENAFFFNLVAGANLQFSTQPDINGVHIVAAGYRDPTQPIQQQARILSGSGTNGWWTFLSGGAVSWLARVNFSTLGVNLSATIDNGSYVGWGIHELRMSEGQATYIINGVTVGSSPITSAVATYVSHLGALRATDYSPKYIGDFGSVICAAGYSASNPEPAVKLLRQRLAAKYGVEIAPPPPSLADYYGIGPGQVPGDWRIDDATVVAGEVTAVRNDGGAGALFELGPRSGQPLPTTAGLYMQTGSGKQMALANSVNLVGVHFMAVLDSSGTSTSNSALLARSSGSSENYYEVRRTSFVIRESGTTVVSIPYTQPGAPALYEMRWDGNVAYLIINGLVVGTAPSASRPSWAADFIGGGRGDRPLHSFSGIIGRCVSVIMDSGYTAAAPEPAVLLARQTLAAQYGVAL